MNGAQHYTEAERLIVNANEVGHTDPRRAEGILAAAQVHATLALAAAQAQVSIDYGFDHPDLAAAGNWHAAIETAGVPA
jgi:hypothetical protein